MELSKTYNISGYEIKVSTGKLAKLAHGSVLLQVGGTSLLAAVTIDKKDAEQDFFPLSVEYIEKMYARGAILGGRFQKREGLPSEEAIIKARQVDHSIRSLFPKSFKKATSVVLTVLSYDQENDPEFLAVLGASLSLMMTGMPFYGPSSGVVACLDSNNNVVINPKVEGREVYQSEFLITGVDDKALSIEGWAKEISEELMDKILDESMVVIKELNALQNDFVSEYKKVKVEGNMAAAVFDEEYSDLPAPKELIDAIKESQYDAIKNSLFQPERADRATMINEIKSKLEAEHIKEGSTVTSMDISNSIEYIAKKIIRESILKEGKRRLGRGLTDIRPMDAEIDIDVTYLIGLSSDSYVQVLKEPTLKLSTDQMCSMATSWLNEKQTRKSISTFNFVRAQNAAFIDEKLKDYIKDDGINDAKCTVYEPYEYRFEDTYYNPYEYQYDYNYDYGNY